MREFRFVNLLGAVGKIRRETWEGREHLVVPVVALVEGAVRAMNAKGFEMVRAEKFGVAPFAWDGRPLMAGHPVAGKTPISANDPRVLARSFGRVHNTRLDNKRLCMEAWIDVEKARSMPESARVLERCEAHERGEAGAKPIEVSVGAGVTIKDESGTWGDRAFRGAWDVIMPDHLALLAEDQVGACSVAMGCGALRAAMLTEDGEIRSLEGEEIEVALRSLGDKPGHVFHGNQYVTGQSVRFDGRSADDRVTGSMPVEIVNPHSNAHLVASVTGKGKRQRAYDKEGRQHMPTATVKSSRGTVFEAYHHTLKALEDDGGERPTFLNRIKQKALEFLRLAQTPDEMSSSDLTGRLQKALEEAEPNLMGVQEFYPVSAPSFVVFAVKEPKERQPEQVPYPGYVDYDFCTYERPFTLNSDGSVTLGEGRTAVIPVVRWEPVPGEEDDEEDDLRDLAARLTSLAGRRHSAADEEMVQSVHDHAVRLGATCAEPRAAAAHECPCKKKNNPIQEEDMDRKQKIAALAANPHSAIKDLKVLETLDEATLVALQASADAQAKAETDLRSRSPSARTASRRSTAP